MEQRILDRGTAGYTRPALRLYNTQAPERLFDLSAEEDADESITEIGERPGESLPAAVAADEETETDAAEGGRSQPVPGCIRRVRAAGCRSRAYGGVIACSRRRSFGHP